MKYTATMVNMEPTYRTVEIEADDLEEAMEIFEHMNADEFRKASTLEEDMADYEAVSIECESSGEYFSYDYAE